MIKLMDLLLEGNTSSTTFYHEVSTAIYCVKPNAKLTNGSDYKIYFDLGLVEAYGSDINKIPEKRFLLDSTANKKAIASNISDAKALAIKIRYQLGNPKRPMYWTGKAGDKGKYGAGEHRDDGLQRRRTTGAGRSRRHFAPREVPARRQ